MKKIGKQVGNEQCVGEVQTPLGTATCVLLENGSILMNLHLIFDIDQYNRQSQNSENGPLNLEHFFCDITDIKSFFVHNNTLAVHSFDHILCSGLSTLQHTSRDIPENWDFAILKPIGDVRQTLDIHGVKFSQWDHTGITNMLMPTHYIYAPILNFETMTYRYHSDLYSPNAITPSIGNHMAILPDHVAERSSGSSGSIALQDGKLFLFNFQRGRLLPAVHLKHDITRAIQSPLNPLHYINLSWVDTGLLTLKSTAIKKYKMELSKEFNLDDLKKNYHFNQLIHNSNAGDNNFDHFRFEFIYDCSTKSVPSTEPLTTQELYLTPYGWKKRAEKKIPIDSDSLTAPLCLYRVIKLDELKALAHGDTSVLHGHMGDYKQALCYLFGQGGGDRVLMEFSVNEKQLFSPENLALPNGNKPVSKTLKTSLEYEYSSPYDLSHGSEGTDKKGKFGMKEESKGESGFSLTFSSTKTHLIFKHILHEMRPILWNKRDGKSQITDEGLNEEWTNLKLSAPHTNGRTI